MLHGASPSGCRIYRNPNYVTEMSKQTRIFLGLVTVVVSIILFSYISATVINIVGWNIDSDWVLFLNYCTVFGLTVMWSVLGAKYIFGLKVPNLKPEIRRLNPNLIVGGVVLITAFNVLLIPLMDLLPDTYMDTLGDFMKGGLWSMISVVIVAPILEEYIFRGVIQNNITRNWGAIWGIVFSSLIFGIIHIIPQQAVSAISSGLVLGSVYYITASLNSVIAIHMLNNGIAYLLYWIFGTQVDLQNQFLGDGYLLYSIYALSAVLVILGGYLVVRVAIRRNEIGFGRNKNGVSN